MSSKKLTITDLTGQLNGLNTNVRYEKMDRDTAPVIDHMAGDVPVKFISLHDGVPLLEGTTKKAWCDAEGHVYDKEAIKHYYEGQEVTEKSATKVFEITKFCPLSSYTDSYIINKYYEFSADDDGHKKDLDKDIAKRKNLIGMRTLWEYLNLHQVVARGTFNVSSSGFLCSDGFIRAIAFGNKWTLEGSIFVEEKVFHNLQENIPERLKEESGKSIAKGLKRV